MKQVFGDKYIIPYLLDFSCRSNINFGQKLMIKPCRYCSTALRYYLRVRNYFSLTCHYKPLYNIKAYKNHRTLLITFLHKNFLLPRQLQFKHATPKTHTINLLNNIWNFDCLMAIQVH